MINSPKRGSSNQPKSATGWSVTKAYRRSVCGVAIIVVGYLVVAYASLGRFGVEKVLTSFAMPVGIGWLLLTASLLFAWFRGPSKVNFAVHLLAWLVLTICGTAPSSAFLFRTLEAAVEGEFRPGVDDPLDVIVVFGGGTMMGPNRPEVSEAGDRVLYAAQLFLQGQARKLVTTGNETSEQTLQIWKQLKISESDIVVLQGANTTEEISNLKRLLEDLKVERIGALSSAYHIPRIQRLAQNAGIGKLIPVAANHRVGKGDFSVLDLVPTASSLNRFSDAYKEVLGRIVGR